MALDPLALLKTGLKSIVDEYTGDQNFRLVREIRGLLENDPEWEEPSAILPIDELETRLDHIKVIERYYERMFEPITGIPRTKFVPLSESMIAAFLAMNMRDLERVVEYIKRVEADPGDAASGNGILLTMKATLNMATVLMKTCKFATTQKEN